MGVELEGLEGVLEVKGDRARTGGRRWGDERVRIKGRARVERAVVGLRGREMEMGDGNHECSGFG